MEIQLVGFGGPKGSGKSTIAGLIPGALGSRRKVVEISVADPVRAHVRTLSDHFIAGGDLREAHPFVDDDIAAELGEIFAPLLQDATLAEDFHSAPMVRAMQYWGTDVVRARDPLYWVTLFQGTVAEALDEGYFVVVPDLRFVNEVDALIRLGGVSVRLVVDEGEREARLVDRDGEVMPSSVSSHSSENSLSGAEWDVEYDSTGEFPEDTAAGIARLLSELSA